MIQPLSKQRWWSYLMNKMSIFIKSESKHVPTNNYVFSIFLIINYMMPLFVVTISGDIIHDSVIYLRILAIIACIPLIFVEYWPHNIKRKYYYIYWHCSLLFCLPFIASYTVLVTHVSEFWLLNAVLSVILLFMLVDWLRFIIIVSLGFVLGFAFYSIALYRNYAVQLPSHDIFLLLYLYLFMMLFMVLFVRRKENAQNRKVENIKLFGGAIAHEVNTPVATTQMLAMTFAEIMQSAEISEKNSKDGKQYWVKFNEADYKMISSVLPENLIRTTEEAKRVIDVLLLLLKHQSLEAKSRYSMYQVVKETVDEYSIDEDKKQVITISSERDFVFHGHKQYIKQVLVNLLNNSFKYAGPEFTIHIWMRDYCLYYRDTGKGIDPKYMNHLFKTFYAKSTSGNGIGLAFCNILIRGMGGEMDYSSELGQYTEFVIRLPEE